MIKIEDVTKVYKTNSGPVQALSGVTLSVETGEFVGVRGPSGCGKSTLLTVLGGLGMPTSGSVVVGGEDLLAMSSADRARFRAKRIGFVFQMFHLLPYLTVLENVVVAALPGKEAVARRQDAEMLDKFQLADRLKHRPAQLSTGECQRVAIARALINQPDLILADEPTGNLDPENSATVLGLLEAFHREGGTVLMVTHQERAAEYARRTIRLDRGLIDPN